MILSHRRIKILIVWFIIITAITLLTFSFIAINSTFPLFYLFLSILIITSVITSSCAIAGYSLGKIIKAKSMLSELSIILSGTLCAAIIAIIISHYIVKLLFGYPVFEPRTKYFISPLLIVVVVTTITVLVERLKFRKDELEKNLDDIKLMTGANPENDSLSIREDEIYHVIRCDDLIYLSSHGKKTILHTRDKDFETNQIIKNIENKLSANFIRIHRQFIINIKYLSQVKYYEGGRYMAYLNDDDESALPIGRKITPVLKEKLGI